MSRVRRRGFSVVATWGIHHPWTVLVAVIVLVLGSGAFVPGLSVSTSRTGLVSNDDPGQQRLFAFYEKYGRPDAPVFVISGGGAEDRRAVVDRLTRELEMAPEFQGRVMGRITPLAVANLVLLQEPHQAAAFRSTLPGDSFRKAIEGGLASWLEVLDNRVVAGLEGEADAAANPGDIASQVDVLATVADSLANYLNGESTPAIFGEAQQMRGLDPYGYLVTVSGDEHIVAVYAQLSSDEGVFLEPIVQKLRRARDDALQDAPAEVTADLTGLPAISVDELEVVRTGLRTSSIAATLGIMLLCGALFRSFRQTVIALVPLLPGVVITLAIVRLFYDQLNLITSSFVAVLLGLGIDFSVHLVARFNETIRNGTPPRTGIREALMRTGPGILTGAMITAAAFLTTTTTDFTAYGELGVITAIGLVIVMAATFLVVPPLLLRYGGKHVRPAPEPPGLGAVVAFVRRAKYPIMTIAIVTAVAGAFGLRGIGYNSRYFDFLPENTESAQALERLEHDPLMSPVFASLAAGSIEDARAMAQRLRSMETVAGVQSPSDLLPPLDDRALASLRMLVAGEAPSFASLATLDLPADALANRARGLADSLDEVRFALRTAGLDDTPAIRGKQAFERLAKVATELDDAGRQRLAQLHPLLARVLEPAWTTAAAVAERGAYAPSDLPPLFAHRFVAKDGSAVALYAVPAGEFWDVDVAERFAADVHSVSPDASGLALMHVRHGRMILAGFKRAALIAAVVIVVILMIDFRSVFDPLLALLPTAVGWMWMLGLMNLFGIDFNVANIVALPLVLGIGIAFGVHMLHRCREQVEPAGTLDEVVRGTGGAIAVAALTTMIGFAGLMLGDYGGMVSLGSVMVLGIAMCLIGTLLVLPAVLLVLKRVQ